MRASVVTLAIVVATAVAAPLSNHQHVAVGADHELEILAWDRPAAGASLLRKRWQEEMTFDQKAEKMLHVIIDAGF